MGSVFAVFASLLAAASAPAGPSFPILFAGEACDVATGVCVAIGLELEADGTMVERNTGLDGSWFYDRSTATFVGALPGPGMELFGQRDPNAPCIHGEWFASNGHFGPFSVCRRY